MTPIRIHMPNSREIVEDMMSSVYQEQPKNWPNGLHIESFVPRAGESVYLVRTKSASTPIGFVGWQVRREGGQCVGYYTVGLMPEHRGQGYAKEAVQKLISIKSAGVDAVKALIQKDNAPSIALAEAIGIPVTKVAAMKALAGLVTPMLRPAARGAAGAAAGTGMTYGLNKATGTDEWANPQTQRAQYLTTGILGAILGQKGVPAALRSYINPTRAVGGSNLLTRLTSPGRAVPPQMIQEPSLRRLLSVASLPGAAYGTPLIVGSAHKPLSQGFEDLNSDYANEVSRTGKDQGSMSEFILSRLGGHVADKLKPAVTAVGDKALDRMEPILRDNQKELVQGAKDVVQSTATQAIDAAKPHLGDFAREMAIPLSASLVGSGLGYGAGSLTYRDDPSLPFEERVKRRDKQQRMKMLFALLGGAGGAGISYAKDLPQHFRSKS